MAVIIAAKTTFRSRTFSTATPDYNSFFRFARDLTGAPSDASKQRQTLGDLRQFSAMVSRSKKGRLFKAGPNPFATVGFWLTECFSNRLTFAAAT